MKGLQLPPRFAKAEQVRAELGEGKFSSTVAASDGVPEEARRDRRSLCQGLGSSAVRRAFSREA
jgi:hypothetical protein